MQFNETACCHICWPCASLCPCIYVESMWMLSHLFAVYFSFHLRIIYSRYIDEAGWIINNIRMLNDKISEFYTDKTGSFPYCPLLLVSRTARNQIHNGQITLCWNNIAGLRCRLHENNNLRLKNLREYKQYQRALLENGWARERKRQKLICSLTITQWP